MGLSIGIAALLILALVFLFFRPKRAAPDKLPAAKRPVVATDTGEFHAVSIKFTSGACAAARNLKGKRFLSSAAPRIPLPDCDVLECKCRFLHHKDRRDGDDRRDLTHPDLPRVRGRSKRTSESGGNGEKSPIRYRFRALTSGLIAEACD